MNVVARLVMACTLCFVVACAEVSVAFGEKLNTPTGALSGTPFVASSEPSPLVGPGVSEDEAAKRASSEAIVAREVSSTAYENLSAAQAGNVLGEAFPAVIDEPAGGPPKLAAGQSITGYLGPDTAQVNLGGGNSGIIQSLVPMAMQTSPEQWSPVNLGLSESSGGFVPTNPLVPVEIPKRLGEGVQVPGSGLSLTPVDARGVSVGGSEGVLDGATVFFANTLADADTVVKPSTAGFSVDTVLRSVESPTQLFFRVGLPQGASVVPPKNGYGPLQVVEEGVTIATIPVPSARDAAGTSVPVSVSVAGELLTLTVVRNANEFQYPIEVDPEFHTVSESTVSHKSWAFSSPTGGFEEFIPLYEGSLDIEPTGPAVSGQRGELTYGTVGETRLYKLETKVGAPLIGYGEHEFYLNGEAEVYLEYEGAGGNENRFAIAQHGVMLSERQLTCVSGSGGCTFCVSEPSCAPVSTSGRNVVRLVELSTGTKFQTDLEAATIWLSQPSTLHTTVTYNTSWLEVDGESNIFHTGGWMGPNNGAFEYTVQDSGLGVAESKFEYYMSGAWKVAKTTKYLGTSSCIGVQCAPSHSEGMTYANLSSLNLPDGEDKIRVAGDDAMEHTWSSEHGEGEKILKFDKTPPHGLKASGLSSKGETLELGETQAHVKLEATDGEGSVPSSGIASLKLGIDGKTIGQPAGSCSQGPCTASGEWSLNGVELGVGTHTLTMTATDNAGNIEHKSYTLNVYSASPVGMGPGSVNPESGDFALGATDVSLSGGAGSLAVTRHYDSRNVKEGEEGPLGPQWTLSLGSLASLEVLPDGSVMIVGPEGLTHFSVRTGGGFEAPAGDSNLTLEAQGGEYLLKDAAKGTTTRFTLPSGAKSWMPTISEGPVATNTTTDSYKTAEPEAGKKIVEPSLELAPHPTASCPAKEPEKWQPGCRGLEFEYGAETKAKGENRKEWGEYKGRLKEVIFVAYNPATKTVAKIPVAAYEYDKQGRLRAEWDPRVTTPLKVTYGYDAEGHVTALTPPGQESWAFTYGLIAGDPNTGRLLKVTRGAASAPLWNGELPSSFLEAPQLSGAPAAGSTLGVSTGFWLGSPVAYAYAWQDCNSEGKECTTIPGATNPNYTVAQSDIGHTLVAQVTATNGGGSVSASASLNIGIVESEYALPSGSNPSSIAHGPENTVWFTNRGTNKVGKITTSGAITEYALPAESEPSAITEGPDGNMWYTDYHTSKIGKLTPSGTITEYSIPAGSQPSGITVGPDKNLWYTVRQWHAIGKMTTSGTYNEYSVWEGTEPGAITKGSDENLWFTTGYGRIIGKITTTGTKTSYTAPYESYSQAIAPGPDGNLWYTSHTPAAVIKLTTSGASTEYTLPKYSDPRGITAGHDGNMWYTDYETNKIGKITTSGAITEYPLATGAEPNRITEGPDKNLWFTEYGTNKIAKIDLNPASGTTYSPQPGTTIEYNVPLEGATAPNKMGLNETTHKPEMEKWGQTDDPVYATAIFPPDEPQGWPASDYKRATVSYLDSQARTVNVATPSGAISTAEYNENNQATRTLGADNRATALKETCKAEKECKSAEVANLLDTKSTYNTQGQLTDTWGPQHTVKLVKGKEGKSEEVLARNHMKYYYNEGAKEVEEKTHETYELVTKTEDFAETASKEESDKRTATTSYSGQSNLGWKLRAPTSVTTDPGGLNLTSTTKYDETTGNVIETKSPAAAGGDASVAPAYSSAFGSKGTESGKFIEARGVAMAKNGNVYVLDTGNNRVEEFSPSGTYLEKFGSYGKEKGQVSGPFAIAVDPKGNVWIADTGNARVEEFNEKREFVMAFGFGVSNGEEKLQTCTSTCKAGIAGAGAGQLKEPKGIAVAANGDIYVAEGGNNRVSEFTETGEFLATFGFGVTNGEAKYEICTTGCRAGISGVGSGQFNQPRGVAVASNGALWVVDYNNNRLEEFNKKHEYLSTLGSKGAGPEQFNEPKGIAIATNGNLIVADSLNDRVQEFTPGGKYVTSFGYKGTSNGQFEEPWGIAVATTGNLYIADVKNNRVQTWTPAVSGNPGAHEGKTIYYTAKEEAKVATCRNHPEWVGLPCQTTPAEQPGVSSAPELPVTTTVYNLWDQSEKVEETFGTTKRTKTTTYDAAGRALTSEETSTNDITLPQVAYKYSTETGALIEQSTTVGETTTTIKNKYNTLGQQIEYTDADGNKATFEYEKEKDLRLLKVKDEKGNQTYHYDESTGNLIELIDSAAGGFKAAYDIAGRMTSQTYPNAMTVTYTHNQDGETTGIEYTKTAVCAKTCPEVWFSDSVVPSIHGETLKQTSSLSEEPNYTYDAAGRLMQVQEIPAAEGCKTRIYNYDEEGNRTTQTTREPGAEGKCATEGGSTQWHTYDTASRMTDSGIVYEAFGNMTTLPAADADGSIMTSEYYVDSQIAKQEQGGETIEYKLDPEDRTRETISKGNTTTTVVSHYDGPGGALAWTSEEAGKKWTRNIPGLGGSLTAIQTNAETPVLQLHDLEGNIVATVKDSEAETKLGTTYNSTEFGVPSSKEAPPKYAWLGAAGVAGELPSGVITQDGITYVPLTGRPLQTAGVPLAAIANNAGAPFVKPIDAWVGSRSGEGAAIGLAKAKQLQEEQELANRPPGAIPTPSLGGAEEGEGEGGGGESGGGCSGMNACAASRHSGLTEYHEAGNGYAGCSVWTSYGNEAGVSGIAGEIEIYGHWHCQQRVPKFEMQVALLMSYEGKWVEIGEPYTHSYFYTTGDNGVENSEQFSCGPEHAVYAAWIFGRQSDGNFRARWWAWGREARVRSSCHGGVGTPEAP